MMLVQPGTIRVFSDIGCPWALLAVHRLHAARRRAGLDEVVSFELRAFPLELFNEGPTAKEVLDAELPAIAALEPDAGWGTWTQPPWRYPVTTILAMEAVRAAESQSRSRAEDLDLRLRNAFFRDSRCISIHAEVMEIASGVPGLDLKVLEDDLVDGRFRRSIFDDQEIARRAEVTGSPHLFLADGASFHNPGIDMTWEGGKPQGRLVVRADRKGVYDDILRSAAATRKE